MWLYKCEVEGTQQNRTEQGIKFYRVPAVITDEEELIEKLTAERRKLDICDKQRRFDREKTV